MSTLQMRTAVPAIVFAFLLGGAVALVVERVIERGRPGPVAAPGGGGAGAAAAAAFQPGSLTQAQVDGMSEAQVMAAWARVAASRSGAVRSGDVALAARLRDEFEMLKQRKILLSRAVKP